MCTLNIASATKKDGNQKTQTISLWKLLSVNGIC